MICRYANEQETPGDFLLLCVSQVRACMQACVIMAGKVKGTKRSGRAAGLWYLWQ